MKKKIAKTRSLFQRLLFFIFIFSTPTFAQDYLNLRSFDDLNSFPKTNIYDITQDDYGYVWLATRDGLIKFDGSKFETVHIPINDGRTLPTEAFYNVFKDSHGNIWGGTYSGGLYRIDVPKNIAYHYPASKNEKNTIPDNRIKKVFEDGEGQIWVGCHKEGFCLYRPETEDFVCYKPSVILQLQSEERFLDDVLSFHYQNDLLWIGTLKGLLCFDPKTEKLDYFDFVKNLKNPDAIQSAINGVKDMVELNEYEILFHAYTKDEVVFVHTILNKETRVISLNTNSKKPTPASSIFKSDNSLYYIAHDKIGQVNTSNWTVNWLYNTSAFSNKKFFINQFFKGNDGQLWARSKRNLYLLNSPLFKQKSFGLSRQSESVFILNEQEILYLDALEKNIGYINLATNEQEVFPYELSGLAKNNKIVKKLFRGKDGEIYGHSDGNIYRLNEANHKFENVWGYPTYFNPTSSESIMSGFLDKQSNYWLGTKNNGILKVDLKNKTTINFKNEPEKGIRPIVYNGYPKAFFQDNEHNVWYGTDVGFGYFSFEKKQFVNFPFSTYTTDDPAFSMKTISNIKKDHQNRIWLAEQYHGLAYFDANEEKPNLKIISKEDGLWDDHIQQIAIDKSGDIWVSHWKGISRIRAGDLTIENFGVESGITSNAHLVSLSDGSLGVLNLGHLQRIFPKKIKETKVQPTIVINDFKVFDQSLDFGKNWNEIDSAQLSYKQNFFTIYFDAINFKNKDMQEIQYQLEGIHDEWVNTNGRDYVSFSNVEGGNFKFKLRAKLKGQEWTIPKTIHLHISSPYWNTWWFYTLLALLIGGIIFGAHTYRIKKIKEKEILKSQFKTQLAEVEMTALRAQMNPHFLFNCLNSIKLFIVKKDTQSAADYLTKFSKLIRLILQNSKNKMIRLSDELETLQLYIELEKMRFDHQFEYKISVADDLDVLNFKIPPLLIQPYVENAIWHGLTHHDKPNILNIKLTKKASHLQCVVEDNGIGRVAAGKRKTNRNTYKRSMGTSITQNRIDLTRELYNIKTNVEFIDLYNENGEAVGTRVLLSIPMQIISIDN